MIANRPVAATSAPQHPWTTAIELTLLGAIWGGSFLFMRIAAASFGPFALVEVRLSLGALLLAPLLWRGRAHIGPALWPKLALSAAINSAIPFSLFAWGAERAPAGVGAITNSLAVMFTALVAWIFFGERLDARRLVGLALGVMGVGVLASGRIGGIEVWPAALSGTIAAAFYGVGVNFARQQLAGVPSGAVAAATLVFAAAIEAPLALAFRPTGPIPATSWLSAALLGVLCTGAAYFLYFRLIQRVGALRASTVTYIVPLFGVWWAWLLLGEPLTAKMAIAAALILGGIALSRRPVAIKSASAPVQDSRHP